MRSPTGPEVVVPSPTGPITAADRSPNGSRPAPAKRLPATTALEATGAWARLGMAPVDTNGPRIRLSLAWTAVTACAILAGQAWLGVWLALVCAVAAAQACRTWRAERRPPPVLAAVGALVMVTSVFAGRLTPALAAGAILAVAGAASLVPSLSRHAPLLTGTVAVVIGGCGAAMVAARTHSALVVMVLVAMAGAYDAGSYLVGAGAGNSWEGPVAGVTAVGAVTLALAAAVAISNPGPGPWALGGLAAVLAPAGTRVASLLLGNPAKSAGVVRRLDSLILLAPAWAIIGPLILG